MDTLICGLWCRRRFEGDSKGRMKGQDKLKMGPGATSPDIATVFCEDAREWDDYLTDCFRQQLAPKALSIVHEKLEELPLPLAPVTAKNFTQAKVVLVIISPDFLDTVERRGPELFDLGRLLEPGHTIAMLCGVTHDEVGLSHRAAFPSYSSWPLLVAKNQDKDFVLSVVSETCSLLKKVEEEQEEARKNASALKTQQFRLSPRKVQEGSTKIFVMLNQAVQQNQKFEVLLESGGIKDIPVKWRNPYVLQFVVPDSFLQTSKIINVHVRCDGSLLGVRQLKCESKLSELHNLLQTAVSPYEMLCLTTGLATLHEVDIALTKSFQSNIPSEGFAFLKPQQLLSERKRSEELLPTLLHFAAYYGLQELASTLLQCPGALHCCFLLNCKGQTPAALATGAGHRDIASMLNDFQKVASATSTDKLTSQDNGTLRTSSKPKGTSPKPTPASIHYANDGMANYDTPNIPRAAPISNPSYGMTDTLKNIEPSPEDQMGGTEDEYLIMMPFCTPPQQGTDTANKLQSPATCPANPPSSTPLEDKMQDILNMEFSNTQEDLIKIIEMYKKGVPFSQVEQMFDVWKKNFEASKTAEECEPAREKHRQKGSSGKQFFNFSDIRHMLTGKSPRRGSNASMSGKTSVHLVNEDSSDGDAFRRVSTLSAASTSSSGSNASSSSSDRLSTMSSISAYDSGTHSDVCDDTGRAPVPPPRPPRFPGAKQNDPRTHQYYKFPPVEETGLVAVHKTDDGTNQTHTKSKLGKPNSNNADYLVADMQSLMRSLKQTNQASTPNEAAIRTCRGSADIYYDIPQMPRPVLQRHNPLLDYDFPAAALRRVAQQQNKQHSDNEQHYYDIPKFSYPSVPTREARLSIPDVPPPPVPVDD
ncbi:B-cell scaffold protein with ankyrin repeats-like isoform X2 [Ornithodoros turicata]|uniref:B-cell scaffold protein with ankyrin repeats-like isoform X2 n=1 Tax=Ornithodoros turicata TaxID=34597 RepID=UPI00313897F5